MRDRTLVKMAEDDFDAVIATHLKGTFNCTRHAVPVMKEAGYGRIVNVTSSAGLRGNFGQTNYGAAKAGIMGMTFVWALELAKSGITVNAIAPAGATRMTAALAGDDSAPDPRLDPAMNAPLVAFLASDRAAHVNGQLFGRTDFSYTLFQHPKQIAWMTRTAGGTPSRWPTSSTTCWASTSRRSGWSCPRDSPRTPPGHDRGAVGRRCTGIIVNHVGLCVTDLEPVAALLRGGPRIPPYERSLQPPDGVCSTLLGVELPVGLTVAYLVRDGFTLELLYFDRPGNPPDRERLMPEPGLTHLSFNTTDLDAVLSLVPAFGGQVLEESNVGVAVMVPDPDGQLLELIRPAAH